VSRWRRLLGSRTLGAYRFLTRAGGKLFSSLVSGAFAQFGKNSFLELPVRLQGETRIAIGSRVYVGAGSWLQVLETPGGESVALRLGDGTNLAGHCIISAATSVQLGRDVLVASNVYIADHQHEFERDDLPVIKQGVTRISPVEIGDGAWLGENVVVGPGVRIGRGAVVGANAVVLDDVPDRCVAVGAPARVIRELSP